MKFSPWLLINLVSCLMLYSPVSAQAQQQKAEPAIEITLVVENIPPFTQINQGAPKGYVIDLMRHFEKRFNWRISYSTIPWARAYQQGMDKENMLFAGIIKTPKRAHLFNWLLHLEDVQTSIFKLNHQGNSTSSVAENYDDKTFAIVRDSHKAEALALFFELNNIKRAKIHPITSREQVIQLFYMGRVDYMLGSPKLTPEQVKQLNLAPELLQVVGKLPSNANQLYLAANNRTSAVVIRQIKTELKRLKASGELSVIKKRWNVD